jgi:uncharacterized protein YndB with AHSA1/START domain
MTTFSTQRLIPVDPSSIFAAFQNPERLARWWGPAGFTNTFETFEFQPGGKWVYAMHGPNGRTYPNESVFVVITPNQEVVIRHVSLPHYQLVISLRSDPAGTLVTWDQTFDDDDVARGIRHIVEPSNEQNLDRLSAEVLSGDPSAA